MESETREYQRVIDYLCKSVEKGELTIGSRIPTERKLAEMLSISRNSTREAIRILENMGVIESRHGSGNYIVGKMSETVSNVIEMMLLLQQTSMTEIITFRRRMEKTICNVILENGNIGNWYEEIYNILSADTELQSVEEQIEADQKFHYMLIQATENKLWITMAEAISTVYHRFIDKVVRYADDDMKHKLKITHMEILSALKKGSSEECEKAIDEHYNLIEGNL